MNSFILGPKDRYGVHSAHLVTAWDYQCHVTKPGHEVPGLQGYGTYSIELDEENEHGHILFANFVDNRFTEVTDYLAIMPCFTSAGKESFPGHEDT
jgi:hypothetical protein